MQEGFDWLKNLLSSQLELSRSKLMHMCHHAVHAWAAWQVDGLETHNVVGAAPQHVAVCGQSWKSQRAGSGARHRGHLTRRQPSVLSTLGSTCSRNVARTMLAMCIYPSKSHLA